MPDTPSPTQRPIPHAESRWLSKSAAQTRGSDKKEVQFHYDISNRSLGIGTVLNGETIATPQWRYAGTGGLDRDQLPGAPCRITRPEVPERAERDCLRSQQRLRRRGSITERTSR
jgi:hypothetical protein